MCSVIVAVPVAAGFGVNVSTPVGDTAGPAMNRPPGTTLSITKSTVWPLSFAGPGEIPVAHGFIVYARVEPSAFWFATIAWLGPTVKLGASFTHVTVTVTVAVETPFSVYVNESSAVPGGSLQ